tara:strand:- start:3999 stop:4298 length:300 start_codon:yes stop_codon:yes gene_type:complete
MLATLTALATKKVAVYAGMGVAGGAVAFALKKVPNNVLKAKFGMFMYRAGVVCTLGLAKWKWTKGVWNKVIEPWVVDAIDNIVANGISEFVRGLRSDNA